MAFGRRKARQHTATSKLGNAFIRNEGVHYDESDVADQQNRSTGAAAGVHGLTGAAFLQIPYTPAQVEQMERRGTDRVAALEAGLQPTMQRIDQLSQQLEEVRSGFNGFAVTADRQKIINAFETVPNSGITEQQYRQAQADIVRMEAEDDERGKITEALRAEIEQQQGSVVAQRAALRRELMEDPTVRYTEIVRGEMRRQHIDVNGSMGGMVADGVNAEPGAFIDLDSTVRGHGLTIAEGAQIINSDVHFEYGAKSGSGGPGYRVATSSPQDRRMARRDPRSGKMVVPTGGGLSPSFKATIDDAVVDSVVTWKRSTGKDARGYTNTRAEKVVQSKAGAEADPSGPM